MKKKYKIAALSAAGLLLAGNAVHAALYRPKKEQLPDFPEEKVNLDRYTETLCEAIRCKTVSNLDESLVDWDEFYKLHRLFENKYPLLHKNLKKRTVGKAGIIYTWQGSDPSLKPIALIGHQDVVPVEEKKLDDWTHPPFAGEIAHGHIWGRGSTDMKNHVVGILESVETLLEEGFTPRRTVIICLGYNEELVDTENAAAPMLSKALEDDGIKLESVLDEGGAILDMDVPHIISNKIAGIGIAEKGYADFEISVDAKGGHSSTPPRHSAVGELSKVILDLENHQFPARITQEMKMVADTAARNTKFPVRLIGCNLGTLLPILKPVLAQIPPIASVMRTTTAVTMTQGSPQANVMPQKATATVNFRILPGNSIADVEKHIHKVVRNKNISVRLLGGNEPSLVSPTDTRTVRAITQICCGIHDMSAPAPFMVMGATDARHYQNLTDQIYRFSPFIMPPEILMLAHGTDERISLDCLENGIVFFKRYIRLLAGE
ncbi:MAG: M20/M25/M40 family metallo-hydrolase [Ruminococcaceae bacterium]|nr:M20/M25/M40 family metallo-hydrolase [Oscillospiraceae bacterium]